MQAISNYLSSVINWIATTMSQYAAWNTVVATINQVVLAVCSTLGVSLLIGQVITGALVIGGSVALWFLSKFLIRWIIVGYAMAVAFIKAKKAEKAEKEVKEPTAQEMADAVNSMAAAAEAEVATA